MTARAMTAMYVRLGFSANASSKLVVNQGMDDLQELGLLSDKEVDTLMKAVKTPGGAAIGELVSMRANTNLKLACFFIRHKDRTSRACTPATVTLAKIRTLRGLRTNEMAHTNPTDTLGFTINGNNWPKTIDALSIFLSKFLGITKVPLGYVIRNSEVPPEDSVTKPDPPCGLPDSQYISHTEELLARAPFFENGTTVPPTEAFIEDNSKVWDLISTIFKTHPSWTIVRPFQRSKDGRNAFLALYAHHLGPSAVDNMSSAAEKALKNEYKGETKKYNFDKYVRVQMDQHQILSDLTEHGYAGIDERSKVRHLMEGIKTAALDNIKTAILSSTALRSDFTACVGLYKDFIFQSNNTEQAQLMIAAMDSEKDTKRKRGGRSWWQGTCWVWRWS